ncbi:MAG: hypothetical protein HQ463_04980 [Bacteroidetes bacterium]|nr:hypothetical protein [Bacteroidota bacterium]
MIAHQSLKLDSLYTLFNKDSIRITNFKFYISNFTFLKNGQIVFKEKNSFHLLDLKDTNSFKIHIKSPQNYTQIQFCIGIDSVANSAGAMGGILDPTKGMYWTWQNGYINMKLEGTSSACKTRNNEFVYHIGGYQYPFNSLQSLIFKAVNKQNVTIGIELNKFFSDVNSNTNHTMMSPSLQAVKLAEIFKTIFVIE